MKLLLYMDKMSLSLEFNTLHTHNRLQYQIDSSNIYTKTYFVIPNCSRETPSLPSSHTHKNLKLLLTSQQDAGEGCSQQYSQLSNIL